MKIFMTGATGFVGAHVVQKLHAEGHRLCLLTTKPNGDPALARLPHDATLVTGNLAEPSSWRRQLEQFQPEATLHLAWEGIPRYDAETSIRNLQYGLALFRAVANLGCPLILSVGSGWEYGLQTGKMSEDMPSRPFNAFGAAKTALQWLGAEMAKERQLRFIWARIFYVYGPGQRRESLTPYIIRCVKDGKNPELKNPLARNDFIYVEDVADALTRLLGTGKNGVYNIGSGRTASVQDVVSEIYLACNRPLVAASRAAPSQTDAFSGAWADIGKLQADTGWQPKTSLAEGIRKMVAASN